MSLTGVDLSFVRELPLTRRAIEFAREHHGAQRRDADGAPFLVHPLEVAELLERLGYRDPVVAAAVLHDVLEDTEVERRELAQRFGPEVCHLVDTVSDDESIEDVEARKADVRERVRADGADAAAVFAADKISKVRELRLLLANHRIDHDQAERKLHRYREGLKMLRDVIPDSPLVDILPAELELVGSPPSGSGNQRD